MDKCKQRLKELLAAKHITPKEYKRAVKEIDKSVASSLPGRTY